MAEHHVSRLLRACAEEAAVDQPGGWQAIQARLPRVHAAPVHHLRLRLSAVLIAVVLCFSTAAAFGPSLLQGLLDWLPNLHRLQNEGRLQSLNLSQEQNGYTVTIRGAAADPETGHIFVIYNITAPDGTGLNSGVPPESPALQLHDYSLTDPSGAPYMRILGSLTADGSTLLAFVAPDLQSTPMTLHLHLEMHFALFNFRPYVDPPGATPPPGRPTTEPYWEPVAPPFVFEFTIPTTPQK